MTDDATLAHPPFDALVGYWLGETDGVATEAIDEHLLGCDACGARLDDIIALGHGIRDAFDAGLVDAVVSAAFVQRMLDRGRRVREYRVPRDGSVECGVAPDDDLIVGRLQAPLAGVSRLDVVSQSSLDVDEQRLQDIPFDPAVGEVLIVPGIAALRRLPSHHLHVRLLAVSAAGEQVIGAYTLNHHARPEAAPAGGG